MTQQMTIEEAQQIVSRYDSEKRDVEREFQGRRVAAFEAMKNAATHGPDAPASVAYRALMVEESRTFKARVFDIYETYPEACAIISQQQSADARARTAAAIGLAERIAYDDGER